MNLAAILHHPLVRAGRELLGHAAIGLGTAWVILLAFELWRPGAVSWYVNLNLLLGLALVAWVCGTKAQSTPTWWYVSLSISAILVTGSALVLVSTTPWLWWVPPLALVSTVVLERIFKP